MDTVSIGSLYKHYKGHEYRVIGIAKHSETLEELVVYQDTQNTNALWARPLSMFVEEVEVGGKRVPRFQLIEDHE